MADSVAPMPAPFDTDRTWTFPVPAGDLWAAIADTASYRRAWPWLRRFEADGGLAPGATWRCLVQPPLPYAVRFSLHVDEVEPGRRVAVRVSGDIGGTAELWVDGDGDGRSQARLVSSLAPRHPLLRWFARVGRPMVRWGHDWVLSTGSASFARRLQESSHGH
jgi:hypothetical protein